MEEINNDVDIRNILERFIHSSTEENRTSNINEGTVTSSNTLIPNADDEIQQMCEKSRIEILTESLMPELIKNEKQKKVF